MASIRSPIPGPVRVLVRDVVADYSERSLNSALPPIGDPESVVRDVLDRVAGFGPLQRYLDDPEIEEIWVNEPGRVFVARRGRSELTTTILAPGELADLVERMLRTSGRRIDMSTPFVDAMMPDGSRLHVVIPDITRRHMAVNIRKFVLQAHHLDELVALGTLTAQAARFLEAAVAVGPQRAGLRRHAGRQDDAAQLPVRRDPRARAGHHVRGGLRAAGAAARRRLDADAPAQPRGRR